MKDELLKNLTRVAIWLTVFFALIAIYMYSIRVGLLYNTVTDGLLLLSLVRLGIMALAVATLFLLSASLARTVVGLTLMTFNLDRRFSGTEEIEKYELVVKYLLQILTVVFGYFLLKGSVRTIVTDLGKYDWINLVFGLCWLAFGITLVACYIFKMKVILPEIKELRAKRLSERAPQDSHVPSVAVAAPMSATPATAAIEEAKKVSFCRKCGARLPEGMQFCNQCGAEIGE